MKKPELLSPAGNLKKAKTALAFGADAVYVGVPFFSLRARINDFDPGKIKNIVSYAEKKGKKIYATVNIIAHDRHIKKLPPHLKKLKEAGVHGVIISDPGILEIVKEEWPEVEVHLSTQANCLNGRAAQFWEQAGVKRIILGREATFRDIKEIRRNCPAMELEYFVHGAMCMAYSGRCFLSRFFRDRSANLGDCAHPCRWEYDLVEKVSGDSLRIAEEESGTYFLNSRDLCLIDDLVELFRAGIDTFKIEGRTKSVYYIATVTGIYRQAIDILWDPSLSKKEKKDRVRFLKEELESKMVHRGYTRGFLRGGTGEESRKKVNRIPSWEFVGEVISCRKVSSNNFKAKVRVHNSIKKGEEVEILRPYYTLIKVKLAEIRNSGSGEKMEEAHGGGSAHIVDIPVPEYIPSYSVLRKGSL